MTYREADGGDKIVAFERGMSDRIAHRTFESSDRTAYIVAETFLVVIEARGGVLDVDYRTLYDNGGTESDVRRFIVEQAEALQCNYVRA